MVDIVSNENVLLYFVKYILPHGVFEIPAVILSVALGTRLCIFMCSKITGGSKDKSILYHLKGSIGTFFTYIIPLLIVAAFIEAIILEIIFL